MNISLGYGHKTITFKVPQQNMLGVFESRQKPAIANPKLAVRESVRAKGLEAIVKPGDRVCIVIDDITRPTPSQMLVEVLLDELLLLKVNTADIRILSGLGMHRKLTAEDFRKLLGEKIVRQVQVVYKFIMVEGLAGERWSMVDLAWFWMVLMMLRRN